MEISTRHHLRSDEVAALEDRLGDLFGVALDGDQYEAVEFADEEFRLVLVDGEPWVLELPEGPVLTVHGANALAPTDRVITVDQGAVAFVSDGADIMRPGIVDADETIGPDDPVLVAEEAHGKVLAVGRARTDGADMLGDQGKVVDAIHHVGDDIYAFTP